MQKCYWFFPPHVPLVSGCYTTGSSALDGWAAS
jgi:hypothetical protein